MSLLFAMMLAAPPAGPVPVVPTAPVSLPEPIDQDAYADLKALVALPGRNYMAMVELRASGYRAIFFNEIYRRELAQALAEVAARPDDADRLTKLALAHDRVDDVEPAKKVREKLLAVLRAQSVAQPTAAGPRILLAETLLGNGDYPGAVAAARDAVRVAPTDPEAHRWLGLTLAQTDATDDDVAAAFRTAEMLAPGDWRTAMTEATAAFDRAYWSVFTKDMAGVGCCGIPVPGRPLTEAEKAASRAHLQRSDDLRAIAVQRAGGNPECLRRAVVLPLNSIPVRVAVNPPDQVPNMTDLVCPSMVALADAEPIEPAAVLLGICFDLMAYGNPGPIPAEVTARHDRWLARVAARFTTGTDPEAVRANLCMAHYYMITSTPEKGVAAARKAVALDPTLSTSHNVLAHLLYLNGGDGYQEGIAIHKRLIATTPTADSYFYLAKAYDKIGDAAASLAAAETGWAAFPDDPWLALCVAAVKLKQGKGPGTSEPVQRAFAVMIAQAPKRPDRREVGLAAARLGIVYNAYTGVSSAARQTLAQATAGGLPPDEVKKFEAALNKLEPPAPASPLIVPPVFIKPGSGK